MGTAGSKFKRQPPPLAVRCGFGVMMYGVIWPAVRILEKLGRLERMAQRGTPRRRKRLAENNPFENYVPAGHDVFVATYAKSGTNWMM